MDSRCFDFPNKNDVLLYSINACLRDDILNNPEAWNSSTPNFDRFLHYVTGGDESLIMRIWEIIGYVLTPDNYGRSYFVFQGVPGSGKSTLERLISNMFSYGSVFRIRGDDFGGRFSLQGLEGKAVIIVSDLPGRVFSEDTVSIIKQISGRDCILYRCEVQRPEVFQNQRQDALLHKQRLHTKKHGLRIQQQGSLRTVQICRR